MCVCVWPCLADTPADILLSMLGDLLEGRFPDMKDVVLIRAVRVRVCMRVCVYARVHLSLGVCWLSPAGTCVANQLVRAAGRRPAGVASPSQESCLIGPCLAWSALVAAHAPLLPQSL
jgi:hypothetical protein